MDIPTDRYAPPGHPLAVLANHLQDIELGRKLRIFDLAKLAREALAKKRKDNGRHQPS